MVYRRPRPTANPLGLAPVTSVPLSPPVHQHNFVQIPTLNLYSFLLTAARAGHNSLVVCLLSFAEQHLIVYPELITRDSTIAAVDSVHSFEVFRAFVQAWSEALSVDMSYVVDPLAYAIVKHRLDLVKFLLEVRADPNRRCGTHSRAEHHSRQSVEVGGPLETCKSASKEWSDGPGF